MQGESKNPVEINLAENEENFVITYTITKKEAVEQMSNHQMLREIEMSVIRSLSEKIGNEIFGKVMEKINVDAIAKGVSVRIIQDTQPGRNH